MRSRRSRLVVWASVAAVVGLVTVRVPIPAVSADISRHAQAGWDLDLRIGRSSLSILGGTRLSDVVARATSEQLSLSAEVEVMALAHQRLPIPPLRIRQVRLVRPDIVASIGGTIDDRPDPESRAAAGRTPSEGPETTVAAAADERSARFSWLEFRDIELTLENATVEIRSSDPGATVWQILGLTLSLRNLRRVEDGAGLFHTFVADGAFSADRLQGGPRRAENLRGYVKIEGGHLVATELELSCGAARLKFPEVDIGFTAVPMAVTTRRGVLEQTRGASGTEAGWVPLPSLLEVVARCR